MTNITEHPTTEGRIDCCAIKDVHSNRIVGYSIQDRMTAHLAVSALRTAVARRQPHGTLIVHSDRGGQFRSRAFRAVFTANGLTGSMGRVASAGDNAVMESFLALLQKNVLNRRRWHTRVELRSEIIYWIEHTYNHRRRQRRLGRLTPVEYELAFTQPAAQAASSHTNRQPNRQKSTYRSEEWVHVPSSIDCHESPDHPLLIRPNRVPGIVYFNGLIRRRIGKLRRLPS